MSRRRAGLNAGLSILALALSSCVAPDEIWPDFTDHSPTGYRTRMATHQLCAKPPITTVAVLSPSVVLVRAGSGMAFNMITKASCFESKSVVLAFVPIGRGLDLCLGEDYKASYTGRDGKTVTCSIEGYQPIKEPYIERDLHAFDPGMHAAPDAPGFRY